MPGSGHPGHRRGDPVRSALAFIFFALLQGAPLPSSAADEGKTPAPIAIDKKSLPEDPALEKLLEAAPAMVRDAGMKASPEAAAYFFERWRLAHRILEVFGQSPVSVEKSGTGGEWGVTGRSGGVYYVKKAWSAGDVYLLRFSYFYRAPVGVGLKVSGIGAVAVRLRPEKEEDGETVYLDYDLYFEPGQLPLDAVTEYVPVQKAWIQEDLRSAASAFADFVETAHEDPQSVIDDMMWNEDEFTAEEIEDFQKTFGGGGARR
ncbi:MAG: hypothetical protein ACNS63_13145 [Candidatus Nitrospinota bacterium M3_3B_026]